MGVMEYLITPLKAFCPSTCSKICTHALQTVETQSCVLADTLVFSHFSPKLYTHIWCSWRMGSSLLTVWRPHDFIFGAVRGGPLCLCSAQWALCSGLALEELSMWLRESNSPTAAQRGEGEGWRCWEVVDEERQKMQGERDERRWRKTEKIWGRHGNRK